MTLKIVNVEHFVPNEVCNWHSHHLSIIFWLINQSFSLKNIINQLNAFKCPLLSRVNSPKITNLIWYKTRQQFFNFVKLKWVNIKHFVQNEIDQSVDYFLVDESVIWSVKYQEIVQMLAPKWRRQVSCFFEFKLTTRKSSKTSFRKSWK